MTIRQSEERQSWYDPLDESDREARELVDTFARIQLRGELRHTGRVLLAYGATLAWLSSAAVFCFSAGAWLVGSAFAVGVFIAALRTRAVYRSL